jgi:hypothetical protein
MAHEPGSAAIFPRGRPPVSAQALGHRRRSHRAAAAHALRRGLHAGSRRDRFAFESQAGTHAFATDRITDFRTRPNSLAYVPKGCDVVSRSPEGGEYLTLCSVRRPIGRAALQRFHRSGGDQGCPGPAPPAACRRRRRSDRSRKMRLDAMLRRGRCPGRRSDCVPRRPLDDGPTAWARRRDHRSADGLQPHRRGNSQPSWAVERVLQSRIQGRRRQDASRLHRRSPHFPRAAAVATLRSRAG